MEADAAREQRATDEARTAAEAAATAAAAAEAEAEAAELAAAVALSIALDKEGGLVRARARLTASLEPDAAVRSGVAAIRFALPSGVKVQRRFLATAPLSLAVDYLLVVSADLGTPLPLDGFDLATTNPRRTFDTHTKGGGDVALTLADAGLAPQAVVFVSLVSAAAPGGA